MLSGFRNPLKMSKLLSSLKCVYFRTMSIVTSTIRYLSGAVIFGQMRAMGWIGFFLIAFLPFIGVRFLDWHPGMLLTGYVIDRIVYLLFFFAMESVMMARSGRLTSSSFVRELLVVLVMSYMLLQFFGLIVSLTGIANSMEGLREIFALTIAMFVIYGLQFVSALRTDDAKDWEPKVFKEGVVLVILTGFTILFSLVIGVALTVALKNSMFADFFDTGYGVVIFLFVVIRLVSDVWFFSRRGGIGN